MLSVLIVTVKPASSSCSSGKRSIDSKIRVWTLLVGQISRATFAALRSWITLLSSKDRTPWPIRCAPSRSAALMLSGPAASPAWIVKGTSILCASAKSDEKFSVAKSASAPAKSAATTPFPRYAAARSIDSSFLCLSSSPAPRIAQIRYAVWSFDCGCSA